MAYYRVKVGNGLTYRVESDYTFEEMVALHGDNFYGEESTNGGMDRLHVPDHVKAKINKLLLQMNEFNIEAITEQVNEVYREAVPSFQKLEEATYFTAEAVPAFRNVWNSLMQLQQDYYNNVIIPTLYPEVKCKMCESPMLRKCFPDLFEVDPELVQSREEEQADALTLPLYDKPKDAGFQIVLPRSGMTVTLRVPEPFEINQPIVMPKPNTAYEEWLTEGNKGTYVDYVYELARAARMSYGPEYKETVRYHCGPTGTLTVIRKSNQGDYSIATYPPSAKIPAEDIPEIKGVVLKDSSTMTKEPDSAKTLYDIFPDHLQRMVDSLKFGKGHIEAALAMAKEIQDGSYKDTTTDVTESAVAEEYVPTVTIDDVRSASPSEICKAIERIVRDNTGVVNIYDILLKADPRLVLSTDVYGIQEQFLSFLKRCDKEQLKTETPSSYDREFFDNLYRQNRENIGSMLGLVLSPHLEFQARRKSYKVDAVENNVFRVASKTSDGYRPLVTVRFVKGFFNIEMH